jgi:hypothetical protein
MNMVIWRRRLLSERWMAGAMIVSLMLTSCAAPGNSPASGGSALERANANFGTTVATGAVAGAALGAVAGALLGGHNRAAGAAMGAVAGGALGTGAGYMVARNNSAQAATEDTLSAQIQAAQQRAGDANAAAAYARHAADEARAQAAALGAQYRAGQISATDYRAKLSSSTQTSQQIQTLLGHLQTEEATLRQQIAAAGPNSGPLRAVLNDVETSQRSLQDSLSDITAATSAVPQS